MLVPDDRGASGDLVGPAQVVRRGAPREVHAADLRQRGDVQLGGCGDLRRDRARDRRPQPGALRVGRTGRRLRRGRPGERQDGPGHGRNAGRDHGPFAEAKEYLGSFTIVDCDSLERALEIAARNPAARYWGVEVRPLEHEADVGP
ncbi:MAG: hypothetical protein JXA83_14760 [Acidimicrobiales bacterium]|nr:hypothetical protein [Acidimicrobiales bacterium]